MHPTTPLRSPLPWLPVAALCLLLAACGGGGDSPATGDGDGGSSAPADAPVAGCNTAAYQAGTVVAPTLAELAPYAGAYSGQEGHYDAQYNFVKTGTAALVIGAAGDIRYAGQDQVVSSICLDKVAGPYGRLMYFLVGQGHLDVADAPQTDLGQAWGVSPVDGDTVFTLGLR